MLTQVSNSLLTPSCLSPQTLLNIFDVMSHRDIDYADLYFQLSQDESWVLEDGIIKEGGFHIDRGVGVRAVSGEKTGFAYSDQINLTSLQQCANAIKGIAQVKQGNIIVPNALNPISSVMRYPAINPLESLSKEKKIWRSASGTGRNVGRVGQVGRVGRIGLEGGMGRLRRLGVVRQVRLVGLVRLVGGMRRL